MRKGLHRLSYHLKTGGIIRNLSRGRFYRDACERYNMVYFGTVNTNDDEYAMVRGLTVSTGAIDRHYCVGSIDGYEVILLERTDQLHFPYKQPESYRWTILQIDLDDIALPHIFLDAHHHQAVFYDAFSAKYPQIRRNDVNLLARDTKFNRAYSSFCAPQDIDEMMYYLTPDITATIGHHFQHYDFELFEDKILVYASQQIPVKAVIDNLFRAGVWLAGEIEKLHAAKSRLT